MGDTTGSEKQECFVTRLLYLDLCNTDKTTEPLPAQRYTPYEQ